MMFLSVPAFTSAECYIRPHPRRYFLTQVIENLFGLASKPIEGTK